VGDLVLAKVKGFPAWPAVVCIYYSLLRLLLYGWPISFSTCYQSYLSI